MSSNANLNDEDFDSDDNVHNVSSSSKDDYDINDTTSDGTNDIDGVLLAEDEPSVEVEVDI